MAIPPLTAENTPNDPRKVAIATLLPPFPSTIYFYEEAGTITDTSTRQLWFNSHGEQAADLKSSKDWYLAVAGSTYSIATSTDGGAIGTALFTFVAGAKAVDDKLTYSVGNDQHVVDVNTDGSGPVTNTAVPTVTNGLSGDDPPKSTITSPPSTLPTTATTSTSAKSFSVRPDGSSTAISIIHDGIKPSAAAGIGVGCFLAGFLIAGLLVWFFMQRRQSIRGLSDSKSSTMALMNREKGPVIETVSISSGSPTALAPETGFPQPIEDKAISGEISKISSLIKNHVQSYYHSRAVSPGMIDYDDLQALGVDLPLSVGTLSTLLNNCTTRKIALRFCLAWVVTSRLHFNDSSNTTFLPPEVAKCVQSMNRTDHGSRAVHSLVYTKWRVLTSELLQSNYVRRPFSTSDGRIRSIQAATVLIDSVMRPFADSRMDDGARNRNLEEILKRSAQFAFMLFSQPGIWNFDWQNEQDVKSGSLCIFPALLQVEDENGKPIRPPRPFSDSVSRRLDE